MNKLFVPLVATFMLGMPAVHAMDVGFNFSAPTDNVVFTNNDHGIHIDGQDILIDNDQGDKARIGPDGTLTVNHKTVAVTASQKALLQRYNQTVMGIRTKGIELGKHAVDFAMNVAGDAIAALFSGASEDEIDRHAKAEADKFKLQALPLCKDVQTLKQLQNQLIAEIPAFQPFNVVKAKDAEDCEHDIKSSDD